MANKEQLEAAKMARNAYARRWCKNNRDKVRATAMRYWTKKAQEAEEQKIDGETDDKR